MASGSLPIKPSGPPRTPAMPARVSGPPSLGPYPTNPASVSILTKPRELPLFSFNRIALMAVIFTWPCAGAARASYPASDTPAGTAIAVLRKLRLESIIGDISLARTRGSVRRVGFTEVIACVGYGEVAVLRCRNLEPQALVGCAFL